MLLPAKYFRNRLRRSWPRLVRTWGAVQVDMLGMWSGGYMEYMRAIVYS